ncbi:type III secretion system gatekeeper subunit SctW [Pseudomonas sp. HK3]
MSSIIQGHINSAALQPNTFVTQASNVKGQYKGQSVTLAPTNHLQAILNAAEEATMQASEKAEKKLSNRKAQERTRDIPISVKKIQEYLQKLPDLERKNSVQEFVSKLLQNPNLAYEKLKRYNAKNTKGDLLFSDDPSLQFAALSILKDAITGQEGLDDLKQELDNALANELDLNGPAIISGINISQAAEQHSNSVSTQFLRNTYRDSVLDYQGLTNTYRNIIKNHGEDNFDEIRAFLLSALSADMNAQGSSIPIVKLTVINDDMFYLKVLGGIHDQCSMLILKMKTYFHQQSIESGQMLMAYILDIKEETWLQPDQFFNVTQSMGLSSNLSHRLYFLTEIHKLLRLIPLKAYADSNDRDTLLQTSQEALNEIIELLESSNEEMDH